MNDTAQSHSDQTQEPFEPQRLRRITDMRRSDDDRMVAGVCAGAARYLNIDPIIVRVVIAVLALVGFAGGILYLAAWFLLPSEGAKKSIAADWFHLDKNEERVRVAGLVIAGVAAALAIVGDSTWGRWGLWWLLVPFGALYYLFAVRPRRRRDTAAGLVGDDPATVTTSAATTTRPQARPGPSHALTWLTLSAAAIAVAGTRIWAEVNGALGVTTYLAVALSVVALGLLVGTVVGRGGPLILVGLVLAALLTAGSLLPSGRVGEQVVDPRTAFEVESTYKHGIGQFELDLSTVSDPEALLGRTIAVDTGIGQTRVIVPEGLNVAVESRVRAGQMTVLGRTSDGTNNELNSPALDGPHLTIKVHHRLGEVEVIRR